MDAIEATKKALELVVALSVSHTVASVIRNTANPQDLLKKTEVVIGSYVIGALIAERAKDWTNAQVDIVVTKFKKPADQN